MFMAANWTFLTSHAPARIRIGTPPGDQHAIRLIFSELKMRN